MLNKLKLSAKLNVILLIVFLLIIGLNGIFLAQVLQGNAEKEVTSQALLMIETMGAVRTYTSEEINPELKARLQTEPEFLKQTVPGYSARRVVENLQKRGDQKPYQNYFYKEATLNPTNPRDKTDSFEQGLVEKFRKDSKQTEFSGFRSFPGGQRFYVARPISVSKESCLECHSTPAAAPKSQLATYGDKTGFGWKLNEIVGAQMIYVPASQVLGNARKLQFSVMGILLLGFLIAMVALNLFLNQSIVSPLKRMAQWSKQVSTGGPTTDFEHRASDEIGILAASLNRLKVSLGMAMDMLNQNQPPADPR
jgi:HAMP domain-containing protein